MSIIYKAKSRRSGFTLVVTGLCICDYGGTDGDDRSCIYEMD